MIVPFQNALSALDLLAGWKDRMMPVERVRMDGRRSCWHVCGSPRALVGLVQRCDELYSDEITLRLPEPRRWGGPMGATILWVRVEGDKQLEHARKFRPLPTMAVAEGSSSRRWLIWAVDRYLPYFEVDERNRKIAYRIGAVQKHGLPEGLRLPAPGSCVRMERARPVPVVCRRLVPVVFDPDAVTRGLRSPPEPKWMEARA